MNLYVVNYIPQIRCMWIYIHFLVLRIKTIIFHFKFK